MDVLQAPTEMWMNISRLLLSKQIRLVKNVIILF